MAGTLQDDMEEPYVPDLIRATWLNPILRKPNQAQFTKENWNQSTLALACLQSTLSRQRKAQSSEAKFGSRPLFEIAIAKIVESLENSEDLEQDAQAISHLDKPILSRILKEESLSYKLLRMPLRQSSLDSGEMDSSDSLVDIDVAIIHNERHMRSVRDIV
ncbi:MAG: hypothetical protein MMC33_009471 [Icmadophila ericetorum]|nr:hypothetical protein [Icmadophila ericetorum]